ncbi:MAG: DUF362 domain-containing protein, partial [Chloroflexota bacterium]
DLCTVVRPTYAIVDATVGMEGLWQYPDDTKDVGLVIAGSDALYVDIVAAALMDIDPSQIMHLQYMAQKEGKSGTLDAVELVGEDLASNRQHFVTGFDVFQSRYPEVDIRQGESACSGCTNELVSAITYMKKAGYEEQMKGLTVVIGNASDVPAGEKVVALGRCSAGVGARTHIQGCPPKEDAMIDALCGVCGADPARVKTTMDEERKKLWETSSSALES